MSRKAGRVNIDWNTTDNSLDSARLDVLMDIRDELQRLNALLHCPNFTRIPHTLDYIRINTSRLPPRSRRKKAKP